MTKKTKNKDLLPQVKILVDEGSYLVLRHAIERGEEREISALDYERVLTTGWHEKRKDTFKESHNSWCYSIRSQPTDERHIRVVISFSEEELVVVTLIDLDS